MGIEDLFKGGESGGMGGWMGPLLIGAQIVGGIYNARQQNKQYGNQLAEAEKNRAFQSAENEKDRALKEALERMSAGASVAAANASAGATMGAARLGAQSSRFNTQSGNVQSVLSARMKALENGPETVLAAGKPRIEAAEASGQMGLEAFDRLVARLQGAISS